MQSIYFYEKINNFIQSLDEMNFSVFREPADCFPEFMTTKINVEQGGSYASF